MKVLSFIDYVSRLSLNTIVIYNKLKYKNFCKLIGKTLYECIKFAQSLLNLVNLNKFHLHYDEYIKRLFIILLLFTQCQTDTMVNIVIVEVERVECADEMVATNNYVRH